MVILLSRDEKTFGNMYNVRDQYEIQNESNIFHFILVF